MGRAWESPGTHAHIACAECLPEVFIIRDKKNKPPLIDMSFVKGARMNLSARCATTGGGRVHQCAMKKCYTSFHPLCARASGFAVERHVSDGRPMMFCKTHSGERWLEQRRVTAGKPAKDLLAKTEGATAQAAEATEEAAVNAEVIEEDAVGVGKSKFLSLNGTVDAVKPEPEREESGDGYTAAAAATATRLWDGFAPFIADKRERSRFGKVARKLLADSGMDQKECGRLAALDASAGEAEASRAVCGAGEGGGRRAAAGDAPDARARRTRGGGRERRRGSVHAVARASRTPARGRGLAVGEAPGGRGVHRVRPRRRRKAPTVLSHLMHLRDSMGVKGSHLLVCQPETIAAWTSELNRWCPRLRAVTLSCPADERNPAKAAILRAGADLIIVPTNVLVEAKAAEAKAAEAAEAAEAKAAEAPVETDEARAAARAAEDEEAAAAAAAAAEASSSKKSKKKKKKKKKKSTGGGGGHARKPEEDGVLPSSLTKLTFHTVIVDAVGDAAEDALPELARSEPHARVKFSRAIVVARDTINARGGVLRAALSIMFPAVFDAVAAIAREGDDANDEYVDAEVLEQEWSATGGALRRMTTLRRVADLDVGADRRRVDETVIVARSQSSLFQERYSEILGEHGATTTRSLGQRTLNELGALCATDLDGSGKLRALDSLVPRLRVERRAALVVSSLNSAPTPPPRSLSSDASPTSNLDAPDLALGTRLHAVGRFPREL